MLITEIRDSFKKFAGDNSISDADIEYYVKEHYNDFAKEIRDTNIKGLVPLVIEKRTVTQDSTRGPYILLPNDTVVWRLFGNQQTEFVNDGTNYKIYLTHGYNTQLVEYVEKQELPIGSDQSEYKDDICKIIIMKGVADYYSDIKEYEEEQRMLNRVQEKMAELRKGFKQEFIYSESEPDEEIKINI